MIPAVPPPEGIRRAVDITLAAGWRFDPRRRAFVSDAGERVTPRGDLPRDTRIVPTVPSLAGADPGSLSPAERDLQRHLKVVLPAGEPPERYVDVVRAWPAVERADPAPEVSLPGPAAQGPTDA